MSQPTRTADRVADGAQPWFGHATPGDRLQRISPAVVSGLGLVLLPFAVSHLFAPGEPVEGFVFSSVTTVLSVTLLYAGYWLVKSPIPSVQYPKVALWTLVATVVLGAVLVLMVLYQRAENAAVSDPLFFVTGVLTFGATSGFLIGLYDARRVRAERLVREQEKVEMFNQILRHNVLNATNIIRGRAELLQGHVDDDGERHLETVLEWSTTVSDLAQKVRVLVERVNDERSVTGPVDLGTVLRDQLEKARQTHDGDFDVVGEFPDRLTVLADQMLADVFENILENAVEHNDADVPSVELRVEKTPDTVVTLIADNGPGIPDDRKDDVFGRSASGLEDTGVGLGLYLVDQFVEHYGGSVWVEDNEPSGSVFVVELPRAAEGA